ncbi:MAG: DUF4268 domain-containing protein [Clostridia bacterium]|nr:DUF4268 domain-containing protein [Clostridia bacterium]
MFGKNDNYVKKEERNKIITNVFESEKRELNVWSEMLLNLIKETVYNKTKASDWYFARVYHDAWTLKSFTKRLASKKAYKEFLDLTGLDIRDYDWKSSVRTKDEKKIVVHQLFADEHMTTAYDFKEELIWLFKQNKLSKELIKELISKQRMCWITRSENKKLNENGFIKHRADPLQAYKRCGIEIFEEEKEDLVNIMKPTFPYPLKENNQKLLEKRGNMKNIEKRIKFFIELKDYFEKTSFDGKYYTLYPQGSEAHAWFENKIKSARLNVRVNNEILDDINLYINYGYEKLKFNKLKNDFKNYIEKKIGYNLVWDENKGRTASRIGRFGKCSIKPNRFQDGAKLYDFDLDVEKVAKELVNFYNVFVPVIESNL